MMFRELKGIEGIDKLTECVPFVEEILSDREMFDEFGKQDMTWMQAAAPIYKKHTESIEKIFEILEEEPESSIATLTKTAEIITSIFTDKEIKSFFIASCRNLRLMISAMASTEGEQSADS